MLLSAIILKATHEPRHAVARLAGGMDLTASRGNLDRFVLQASRIATTSVTSEPRTEDAQRWI